MELDFIDCLMVIIFGPLLLGIFMTPITGTYNSGYVLASIIIAIFLIIVGEWLAGLLVIASHVILFIHSIKNIDVSLFLKETKYRVHNTETAQKSDNGNQRIIFIVLLISAIVIAITFSIILYINNYLLAG